MKTLKNILLSGCTYAVVIISLFFAFAAISDFTEAKLSAGRFFLMLFFGHVVACAGYILRTASWHAVIRYPLHYVTLFLAFYIIFILALSTEKRNGAAMLIAVVIYTFFYILIMILEFLLKKTFAFIEKSIGTPNNEENEPKSQKLNMGTYKAKNTKSNANNKNNKTNYSPRFK